MLGNVSPVFNVLSIFFHQANKPLLERKRRARINDSLTDLKHLVLTSLNKDVSKFAKMEKVDILDMTVRYLKSNDQSRQPGKCVHQLAHVANF